MFIHTHISSHTFCAHRSARHARSRCSVPSCVSNAERFILLSTLCRARCLSGSWFMYLRLDEPERRQEHNNITTSQLVPSYFYNTLFPLTLSAAIKELIFSKLLGKAFIARTKITTWLLLFYCDGRARGRAQRTNTWYWDSSLCERFRRKLKADKFKTRSEEEAVCQRIYAKNVTE